MSESKPPAAAIGSGPLSAAVVVVSYNRPDELLLCLKYLGKQHRMPRQIIVVDGSADAAKTRARIEQALPELGKQTRFEFMAGTKGVPAQRNAGLTRVDSDVTIFLDDDLIPEADFVGAILRVYEADQTGIVGAVEGTAIEGSAARIGVAAMEGGTALSQGAVRRPSLFRRINTARKRWVFLRMIRYIGAFFPEKILAPVHLAQLPASAGAGEAVSHLYGCVMSFRTAVAREFGFNEMFSDYAFMEDLEISWRISRRYALLRCPGARGYHLQSAGGRVDVAQLRFVYLMNLAFIARTCMPWTPGLRAHMIRHHSRYARARFINVFLERSGWASWRGSRLGNREARAVFDAADEDVALVYMEGYRRGRERNYR